MIVETMDILGTIVRAQRRRIPLSQQELADLAGVSRTSIQRIEAGIDTTELSTLLKVLRVLNLTLTLTGDLPHDIPPQEKGS